MVTREIITKTVAAAIILTVMFVSPLWADDMARVSPQTQNTCTLNAMIDRAQSMFKPLMEANGLTIAASRDEVISGDVQKIEERFVNLLSNAVVHAPAGTAIKVKYSSSQIQIWVENSAIGHSIKRDVTDAMGNSFTLETMSGKGTAYAINF
ncbi:MAG: sensor histidine kinase [Candidatus Xenobiia bacterium LiM19]